MKEVELFLKMTQADRECARGLQKKLKKMYDSDGGLVCLKDIYSVKQFAKLKRSISENKEFLIRSLLNITDEPLVMYLKDRNYEKILSDNLFLEFLLRASLTNRIDKACKNESMPAWLSERIATCALVYGLNITSKEA